MFHFPKGKKELLAINGMTKEETLDYHGGLQNMLSCMSIIITSKNGKKPMFLVPYPHDKTPKDPASQLCIATSAY